MTLIASEIDTVLQRAARLAAEHLEGNDDRTEPVIRWHSPEELRAELDLTLPSRGRGVDTALDELPGILERSVRSGHPRFMNQLFGGYDLAGIVGEWIATVLNTSMYTYEVAPVFTLMEEELVARMGQLAGMRGCEGVFTPGGSVSNLMAVLAARHRALPHAKHGGLRPGDRLALFLSEEAHYSLPRAASVLGFGTEAARRVPVDPIGRMIPEELERAIEEAKADGLQPFLVAATSGTTVPGAYDPLRPLGAVASRHGLWFHVDASWGGTVLLSEKHRRLMDGVELADSVTWNPHKGMNVPLSCSALLVKEPGQLAATHALHADYLFHGEHERSPDRGDLSLQCGRHVDVLKLWLSWRAVGDDGYRQRIDRNFALARRFADMVAEREAFTLVREPEGCNVCFRFIPPSLRGRDAADLPLERLDAANVEVRERLKRSGRFLVNYATLDGAATLRLVFVHPRLEESDLTELLDAIERSGANL